MTAMAVTAEELELQDQVTRALEAQGVLGKIKAQLRAAVFRTIHASNSSSSGADATGVPRASQTNVLPATAMLQAWGADACVALELVRNMLECLELDHSLAVFLAEAGLDGKSVSEWREPARLCERVRVAVADETTPVLIKMLRRDVEPLARETETRAPAPASVLGSMAPRYGESEAADKERDRQTRPEASSCPPATNVPTQDLPPPPLKAVAAIPTATPVPQTNAQEQDDDDEPLDASMAEEVAGGSFEEESLAESASMNHSQSEDFGRKSVAAPHITARSGRFSIHKEQEHERDEEEEEEEERSPSIASPPPVPTKLGSLPSLPGMSLAGSRFEPPREETSGDEEEDTTHNRRHAEEEEEEEDDLDEDAAAARLRSLEEQLKEMEAEDDTGVLQQLKGTALHEAEEAPAPVVGASPKPASAQRADDEDDANGGGGDDDDNYGSDFEEEVEEEEEEVASEMSEDIASMSMLSESEDAAPLTKPAPVQQRNPLENDTPVASEDALNSYDYIEAVERH